MMNLFERTPYLKNILLKGENCDLKDSPLEVRFCNFVQKRNGYSEIREQHDFKLTDFCNKDDTDIVENKQFKYPMFWYKHRKKESNCIVLLHGLNERSWDKYGCWAEELATLTGKPVILFPIAFHMNRAPQKWSEPRNMIKWVDIRKEQMGNPENLTFANLALSDRISEEPLRFYVSGRETADNLVQLLTEIQNGENMYFSKNTQFDIFAYSIGAMLSEVLLQANPNGLFDNSRLFMFCGGSILNKMNGNSRYIMDKNAFDSLVKFYQDRFVKLPTDNDDEFKTAFKSMIDENVYKNKRESFFSRTIDRIKALSLKKDTVIPTDGIISALGSQNAKLCLEEMDFPISYTHETPFPLKGKTSENIVNEMFNLIFTKAANFLV